ncbi:hypothetical protein A3H89_02095 [Candidatus Amesbacteria bacterium RIFCSPLOWO2_02_FULL_48_11]|uniref:DNA-deoxyinosine glycosylase n=1 Tax=Candidatus Amesbacteria bacterium RIFCSPHIGHO2_12_FULL_48_14 TaxID=1797257 RepID=A0A1F4ZD61_9BACT|nr:MAG: hypothetical protein A3E17_01475 [Candidatus Amesbacteria bacterium RIFCSPHIGHO2_12_FULL_48_14]OGD06169.1 MAG: hypothetical protein A3H89_02095 [Candidatus Amesbacteria bacterium RIFCSPLOWO2_02_FULL_48_11]
MLETHPFPAFVPPLTKYLILGSFVGKPAPGYDWFYNSPRNQFWSILEAVYHLKLNSKKSQQQLFTRLSFAVTDIIYCCDRSAGNNLDTNLIDIVYNTRVIRNILSQNNIHKIYFTSRFVADKFHAHFGRLLTRFPHIRLITLPSPSPRYAQIAKEEKILLYSRLLPRLQ